MAQKPADLILHNADVTTFDPDQPKAAAVAILGNAILAVGTDEDVLKLRGDRTKTIDARGATLLPGLYESHMHLYAGALTLRRLNLTSIFGEDALRSAITEFAGTNPGDEVLMGFGANYTMLGKDRAITRHDLDAIVPDRPFFMMSVDFHSGWANTRALEMAGILNGKDVGPNGEILMGEDGLATGELHEHGAIGPVMELCAESKRETAGLVGYEPQDVTEEEREEDLKIMLEGMEHCASLGITKIINMDGNRYQLELVAELERRGTLPCRVEIPYRIAVEYEGDPIAEATALTEEFKTDKISCGRVKMFMDGVFDSHTALRLEDYPDRPGFRSVPLVAADTFKDLCVGADKNGLQISVHAVGDGAVRAVLDGYQAARDANGPRDSRHRVEHIDNIHPDDIERLVDLRAVASMQPVHPPGSAGLPLEPTTTLMTRKNWPLAFAWRRIKDAGVPICFATDWPTAPLDPLFAMQCAMTRKPWAPDVPDQRLALSEVLEAYTRKGAYAAFDEDRLGCLKPGFLADLTLIEGDLETLGQEGDLSVKVGLTICDGKVTYRA